MFSEPKQYTGIHIHRCVFQARSQCGETGPQVPNPLVLLIVVRWTVVLISKIQPQSCSALTLDLSLPVLLVHRWRPLPCSAGSVTPLVAWSAARSHNRPFGSMCYLSLGYNPLVHILPHSEVRDSLCSTVFPLWESL